MTTKSTVGLTPDRARPHTETPSVVSGRRGNKSRAILGWIAVTAMLAGGAQNAAIALMGNEAVNLVDDLVCIVLVIFSLPRLADSKALPAACVALWSVFLLVALMNSESVPYLTTSDSLVLFRQVFMPSALILAGLAFTEREWRIVAKGALALGVLNALYIYIEVVFGRLIDPAPIGRLHGIYIYPDGLPGYYHGIWLDGSSFIRAGGIVLNPPTAGIVVALAAVLAYFTLRGAARYPLLVGLLVALGLTGSRAGMLIAFISIGLPIVARLLGAIPASIGLSIPLLVVGVEVMTQGGSASHVQGLLAGLSDALGNPFGRGFGYNGNHADALGLTDDSESLLGIAFSAGGLVPVLLVVILCLALLSQFMNANGNWLSVLGLSTVMASALSETAGSINSTVPLWLFIGYVLNGFSQLGVYKGHDTSGL